MLTQQDLPFTKTGKKIGEVPVEISYRILELFSGGLYSSPTKAIEELVANAFDAMASKAYVLIPANLDSNDASIVVIDDGQSMNASDLQALWKIGYSLKRESGLETVRLPIGKFGIGKLATWVLAKELTHICKRENQYLAITMFYGGLNTNDVTENSKLTLDIRQLTEAEAKFSLPFLADTIYKESLLPLFGSSASESWTATILSGLKPMARDLKLGRLRWVLSTAMPLTPGFRCYLNGTEVEASKVDSEPANTWIIGKEDKVARNLKLTTDDRGNQSSKDIRYGVNLPILGRITGYAAVYKDTLTGGKSEDWGRSHGFFVMVRGRLINLQDPLFGGTPLSHKTFNRFRMLVHCDGLDDILLSSREGVTDNDGANELRRYLRSKFNEASDWYENWLEKDEEEKRLATRLGKIPRGLMLRPLVNMILQTLNGKLPPLRLTRIPTGMTHKEKEEFVNRIEGYLSSEDNFINEVMFEALGVDYPIAILDVRTNKVIINSLHPFYRNYEDHFKNREPFEIVGVAEILTEAYLLSTGIKPDDVNDILARRDDFLRELVYVGRLSAPLAADRLREAGEDAGALEKAVADAFQSLGFEVTPIGGSDEPDGVAVARMRLHVGTEPDRTTYTLTYDAKSTKHSRVQTGNVHSASIDRHRRAKGADYAVVVAKKFSDTQGEDSAVIKEARQLGRIILVEADDFALLVETAATKRLGYKRLRELFETCCAPSESKVWIQKFVEEKVKIPPIAEILHAIYKLQGEQREEIEFADIRAEGLKTFDKKEIGEWLESIARLVPEYLSIRGDIVDLQMHPDVVLRAINMNLNSRPVSTVRDSLLKNLKQTSS